MKLTTKVDEFIAGFKVALVEVSQAQGETSSPTLFDFPGLPSPDGGDRKGGWEMLDLTQPSFSA